MILLTGFIILALILVFIIMFFLVAIWTNQMSKSYDNLGGKRE